AARTGNECGRAGLNRRHFMPPRIDGDPFPYRVQLPGGRKVVATTFASGRSCTGTTLQGGAMTIEGKAVLVTGANRGIGRALVDEALSRGAGRVYAGTRQPLVHADRRVTPVTLDVTNPEHVQHAVEVVDALDILINNAGVATSDDLRDRAALEQHLAVNLFGPYNVTQAFVPLLIRSRGAIVNVLSSLALAALPIIPAYSLSKAAAFSLTQSWR